ncbi:hypothetical protein [Rossellomorea aquimaris]|uniref:Uncharacterized protein n=1 Tax=Rossellomorea aquimaris TaxID=189382 RepID=A0A366ELX2_9BACI|nr:hypothetical protein [Rossellomorea aquimaris]RBP02479.1 hypothetical protein DET59_11442 [Rossellomorea aquimaris]
MKNETLMEENEASKKKNEEKNQPGQKLIGFLSDHAEGKLD